MDNSESRPDPLVRIAVPDRAGGAAGPVQASIESLYRTHFAALCRTLRRLYGEGPPEPEDLAQQAFEKIATLELLDTVENPRAYLFTIAINLGLRSIARIRRAQAYVAEQLHLPGVGLEEIDPSRLYEDKQKIRALDAAMGRLSAKQREIIIRSRFHGHTYADIAGTTGWSQADISRQLNAALKILMDAVDGDAPTPAVPKATDQ